MSETKEKKGFKAGAYAVFAGVVVAVVLVVLTIFAFTTRYTAFSPEKVAQSFTDTIVQTGDGYNSYKMTLVSKNQKYGKFVTNAYMLPYINKEAKQADFVGTGSDEEANAIDTVYATMYDYYVELLNTYGLDDYDSIFSNYFAKLSEVRQQVYGDEYMDTDFMFGAFESNVETYGNSLTGTQRTFASDNKTITQEETIGAYQTMFGDDQEVEVDALVDGKKTTVTETQPVYKLTSTVTNTQELTEDEVAEYVASYKERISSVASLGEERATQFGLEDVDKKHMNKTNCINAYANLDSSDSITAVDLCTVEVTTQNGDVVATQQVYVVQIGNSWYVDETNVDTSALYLAK
jgi:hypothetical protein